MGSETVIIHRHVLSFLSLHYAAIHWNWGFKSFLLQNPVTLLIRIQKRSNLFKMMQIHKIFVPNIFLYQINWIFLDLFAKNMNGWSDNSEILCVEQWGRAGKKTRKQQFYPGSRSWCKYFPNSFTTIFIWKKLWNICSFALGFFNEPFNSSLNITLLAFAFVQSFSFIQVIKRGNIGCKLSEEDAS